MTGPGRLWVDMTNSPHVLVLRPIIAEFERRGWDVQVTAREFAQTVPLLERFGIDYTLISKHRGKNLFAKAAGLLARTVGMVRFGRGRGFDLALSHASNDLPVAAGLLGIPHVTMFDYEHAALSHHINVRLSAKALVPDAISADSLARYGGQPGQVDRYPGLKEEYYLSDMEPDRAVLDELDIDGDRILAVLRTPPSQAAYHRMENELFPAVLARLAGRDDVTTVVLVRTPDQREALRSSVEGDVRIPEGVIDAQSLVAFADLVVSGGGTLNREAAALGTPAYTVFSGKMGAVDEALLRQGRMHRVTDASEIAIEKKADRAIGSWRPVGDLVDRIMAVTAEADRS